MRAVRRQFGAKRYEIRFDSIVDHETFSYLRVNIDIPRDQETRAEVWLNGKLVGQVLAMPDGYESWRIMENGFYTAAPKVGPHKDLGKAIAAVITDFV
jgi:hypothetical protein